MSGASQPSHRDRPRANIGAGWTNTPPAQGGTVHRSSQLITHTTQTTVQTYGDTQDLIRHLHTRLSPTKANSTAVKVQVLLHEWEIFPEMTDAAQI